MIYKNKIFKFLGIEIEHYEIRKNYWFKIKAKSSRIIIIKLKNRINNQHK